MSLSPGVRFGPYEIIAEIGAGGMGKVYRGRDTKLNRDVAIKILPDVFAHDTERVARFTREAQTLASVNHPNIAQIYGVIEEDQPAHVHALVMELVEGEDLSKRIARGPIPINEALPIARQIAEALEAAHEKGIIHRDLKPANIQLTPDCKVKLLDFGLARAFHDQPSELEQTHSPTITEAMTRPGVVLGTAAYMSPEQAKGKPVDKRTDIWAFGCILYECLAGEHPFHGDTVTETMAKILEGAPDWNALPPGIPWRVKDLLRRCLQRNPKERLHDIADARIEIDEGLTSSAGTASDVGLAASRALRSLPVLWVAVFAGLILGSLGTGLVFKSLRTAMVQRSPQVIRGLLEVAPAERLQSDAVDISLGEQRPSQQAIVLSPDGRLLAFSAVRGDRQQLYLRPLDKLEAVPIADSEGGASPFFSPDGKWIGFWANGALRKTALSGGSSTAICETDPIFGASWGDDDAIVFANTAGALFQVPAAGGSPHAVTTLDQQKGEVSHRLPHVLPGARTVLFTAITHYLPDWDQAELVLQPLPNGKRKTLTRGADARYLPTGHLVYVRSGTMVAAPFDLQRMELAGSAVTVLSDVMQAVNTPNAQTESGTAQLTVSQSGLLVYAAGGIFRDPERLLTWVDRSGKVEKLPLEPRPYLGPHLSPDGRRIVVWTQGRDRTVWIYDLARGTMTRVTTEGRVSRAIWNPDNLHITFGSAIAGPEHLASKAADGSGAIESLSVRGQPSSWSPDGRLLAFVQPSTATDPGAQRSYDIALFAPGTGDVKPFANSRFDERYPEFSPDGNWIAYVSSETGRNEVYVQGYPGPGPRQQLSNNGGTQPAWARSGNELFYTEVDPRTTSTRMMSVSLTPGPALKAGVPRVLWEGRFRWQATTRGYDVTADGRRFLMVQPKERPPMPVRQLILVQNWFEELKRLVPTEKN